MEESDDKSWEEESSNKRSKRIEQGMGKNDELIWAGKTINNNEKTNYGHSSTVLLHFCFNVDSNTLAP